MTADVAHEVTVFLGHAFRALSSPQCHFCQEKTVGFLLETSHEDCRPGRMKYAIHPSCEHCINAVADPAPNSPARDAIEQRLLSARTAQSLESRRLS
jgi:hypothetical protein